MRCTASIGGILTCMHQLDRRVAQQAGSKVLDSDKSRQQNGFVRMNRTRSGHNSQDSDHTRSVSQASGASARPTAALKQSPRCHQHNLRVNAQRQIDVIKEFDEERARRNWVKSAASEFESDRCKALAEARSRRNEVRDARRDSYIEKADANARDLGQMVVTKKRSGKTEQRVNGDVGYPAQRNARERELLVFTDARADDLPERIRSHVLENGGLTGADLEQYHAELVGLDRHFAFKRRLDFIKKKGF